MTGASLRLGPGKNVHLDLVNVVLVHDKKHVGIEINFYNLDTFKKQVDAKL